MRRVLFQEYVNSTPVTTLQCCVPSYTLNPMLRRFLFREYVIQITQRYEWWQAVEHAIEHEGWKIVLLLRLTPLVPFNLLNYALACTAVRFWDYSWCGAQDCPQLWDISPVLSGQITL